MKAITIALLQTEGIWEFTVTHDLTSNSEGNTVYFHYVDPNDLEFSLGFTMTNGSAKRLHEALGHYLKRAAMIDSLDMSH